MEFVTKTEAEADYTKGLGLLDSDDSVEEAVSVLGELYGKIVEIEGDLGPSVAPIAYAYGRVNLRLAVQSNQAFVNSEVKKKQKEEAERAAAAGNPEAKPAQEQDEEEEDDDEEVQVLSRDDIEEIFQIAFESLDTSRVIYERLIRQESNESDRLALQKRLSEVMMRLGDLKFEQGLFADSVGEYKKCLELRTITEDVTSRDLASVHHALAMALESLAAEDVNDIQSVVDATVEYSKTLEIFLNRLRSLKLFADSTAEEQESSSKKKAKKSKTLLETLTEEQTKAIDTALNVCDEIPKIKALINTTQENAETKELLELIEDLANKVDDITYPLTKEGRVEEEKAFEERKRLEAEAKEDTQIGFGTTSSSAQAQAAPVTTIGFSSSNSEERENNPPEASSSAAPKSPAKPVNVIGIRKKAPAVLVPKTS